MPAVFRGVCSAETFLNHVVMKQIDFAEIDGTERHTRYRFMTVGLAAAFPVYFFIAVREFYQQMSARIIV